MLKLDMLKPTDAKVRSCQNSMALKLNGARPACQTAPFGSELLPLNDPAHLTLYIKKNIYDIWNSTFSELVAMSPGTLVCAKHVSTPGGVKKCTKVVFP